MFPNCVLVLLMGVRICVGVMPKPAAGGQRASRSGPRITQVEDNSFTLKGSEEEEVLHIPLDEARRDPLFKSIIRKKYGNDVFWGEVEGIDIGVVSNERLYLIRYEDCDMEHMIQEDVEKHIFSRSVVQSIADEEARIDAEGIAQDKDDGQILLIVFWWCIMLTLMVSIGLIRKILAKAATSHERMIPAGKNSYQGNRTLEIDGLCVVCMESPKIYAIIPCGHRCLCSTCAKNFKQQKPPAQKRKSFTTCALCPMCRGRADAIIQIFD